VRHTCQGGASPDDPPWRVLGASPRRSHPRWTHYMCACCQADLRCSLCCENLLTPTSSPVPPGREHCSCRAPRRRSRRTPCPPRHASAHAATAHLVHAPATGLNIRPGWRKHRACIHRHLNRRSAFLGRVPCDGMRVPAGAPMHHAGATRRSCRAPLRRRGSSWLEDPADGRCADPLAELEQLRPGPSYTPSRFSRWRAFSIRRGDIGADSAAVPPVGVGPLAGDQQCRLLTT